MPQMVKNGMVPINIVTGTVTTQAVALRNPREGFTGGRLPGSRR
jgi:hypothetical protein